MHQRCLICLGRKRFFCSVGNTEKETENQYEQSRAEKHFHAQLACYLFNASSKLSKSFATIV